DPMRAVRLVRAPSITGDSSHDASRVEIAQLPTVRPRGAGETTVQPVRSIQRVEGVGVAGGPLARAAAVEARIHDRAIERGARGGALDVDRAHARLALVTAGS